MNSIRQVVRLFHPPQHLWLRVFPLPEQQQAAASVSRSTTTLTTKLAAAATMSRPNPSFTPTAYAVEIGLTERGVEEVGDLTAIRRLISAETVLGSGGGVRDDRRTTTPNDMVTMVEAGDNLLQIEWEGHSITSADELYHTVWETFSGETNIQSPLTGNILDMVVLGSSDDDDDTTLIVVDEDTVLVTMKTTQDDLERAQRNNILVRENDYIRTLKSLSPGKFADG